MAQTIILTGTETLHYDLEVEVTPELVAEAASKGYEAGEDYADDVEAVIEYVRNGGYDTTAGDALFNNENVTYCSDSYIEDVLLVKGA